MLREHATHYYMEDNCNCAEAVLLAANQEYGLGLPEDSVKLVVFADYRNAHLTL